MRFATLALPMLLAMFSSLHAQGELSESLENATRKASDRASPVVAQILTTGGLDVVRSGNSQVLRGEGPATGLVVSEDGYILSSTFNFIHKPAAVTVRLPGNKELLPAKIVAHDHTRALTLLKVDAKGLPVATSVPVKEIRIGQWSLALGRTLGTIDHPPSVSVGIVSAKDRVWGKAIQTDCKVSPVNYGGPLIDLEGRVLGVLVPLSPQSETELAGVEWYDSGIGFAVPLEDIQRILPILKEGKDLHRGTLGVNFRSADRFGSIPVIGLVQPGSPASKLGLLPGDAIVEMEGHKIVRQAQLMHLLGPKYAGDSVSFKIKRGDMELAFDKVVLGGSSVAGLQPAWLGVLPVRDDPEIGVEVRHVFENSPAAKAGLKPGDRILKVNGAPFSGRDQYFQRFSTMQPGEQIKLGVRRKESEKEEELSAKLAEFGVEIPTGKLPPGSAGKALTPRKPAPDPNVKPVKPPIGKPIVKPDEKPAPKPTAKPKEIRKGLIREKDETTGHEFWLLVPESYDPNRSHALVVWLHPAGNTMEERMQKLWGEAAKQHDLIVLAPLAENPTGWLTSESDVVRQDIQFVLANYSIDRQRVVAHGQGNGGNFAFFLGFDARDQIRGVATIGGVLSNQVKDLLPTQRLGFYVLAGGKDPVLGGIRASVPKLKEKKYPVHFQELPELGSGYLPDANKFQELLRWIDSLDRL